MMRCYEVLNDKLSSQSHHLISVYAPPHSPVVKGEKRSENAHAGKVLMGNGRENGNRLME